MPFSSFSIRNVASYNNTGVVVSQLKKLNFFFGYNGTGKSTIARFLRNVSLPIAERSSDYSDCSYSGYDSSKEYILVYDDVFRKENFVDTDKMKGVFSLNHTNAVIDAKITAIEREISKYELKETKLAARRSQAEQLLEEWKKDIVEYCFECRDQFRGFLKQPLQYAHNKNQHFNHLREVLNTNPPSVTLDEIRSDYEKLYENEISEISSTISTDSISKLHTAEAKLKAILDKIIVGKDSVDIASLIKKFNMASWVLTGKSYLQQSNDICPFCQQPLANKGELEHQLNEFFDDSYQKDIDEINNASEDYRQAIDDIKKILEQLRNHTPVATLCDALLLSIGKVFSQNDTLIRSKLSQPNRTLKLQTIDHIDDAIEYINSAIQKNNEEAANLSQLKEGWVQKCWNLMAHDARGKVIRYDNKVDYMNQRIFPSYDLHKQMNKDKIIYLRKQIQSLRSQTVNTREAVDGINKIFQNVGYNDFSIEEVSSSSSNPSYRLKRLSSPVGSNIYHSLSEGEKTFISFLYFYQLCLGTSDMSKSALKKIIVIDDPISSLDSQTLFTVSSIVNKLDIQGNPKNTFKDVNISQIIVLTHNLYFYKEISFDRRPMCTDLMHFRVQKPLGGFTTIESSKKAYPTDDYSLLWKSLKDYKTQTGVDENRNITVCNLMRRIIDSYVNFIGMRQGIGNPTWTSIDSLSTSDPIYIVASSFISQINDESHGVSPFDSVYYGNVIRQDTSTLFHAFELIFEEIGLNHYNMMNA